VAMKLIQHFVDGKIFKGTCNSTEATSDEEGISGAKYR